MDEADVNAVIKAYEELVERVTGVSPRDPYSKFACPLDVVDGVVFAEQTDKAEREGAWSPRLERRFVRDFMGGKSDHQAPAPGGANRLQTQISGSAEASRLSALDPSYFGSGLTAKVTYVESALPSQNGGSALNGMANSNSGSATTPRLRACEADQLAAGLRS